MSGTVERLIRRYHADHVLIGLHHEGEPEGFFLAGYVEEIDGRSFYLRYVNKGGRPGEGAALGGWYEFGEIIWITANTPYLQGLERLHRNHERFEGLRDSRWANSPRSISALLRRLAASDEVVRLKYDEEDRYALVLGASREGVHLALFSDNGEAEGETFRRWGTIKAVRAGGFECRAIAFLITSGRDEGHL